MTAEDGQFREFDTGRGSPTYVNPMTVRGLVLEPKDGLKVSVIVYLENTGGTDGWYLEGVEVDEELENTTGQSWADYREDVHDYVERDHNRKRIVRACLKKASESLKQSVNDQFDSTADRDPESTDGLSQ